MTQKNPYYEHIHIRQASENNLKNIDVKIPHNALTVVSGVSGSGKSSLVFDIIAQEGQARYLRSFSAFARQFMSKLSRPSVAQIDGLRPVISIDQKSVVRNARSTVGTLSEIHDYLRLLLARFGSKSEQSPEKLERSLFSFNTAKGACSHCKGLGVEDVVDPELLVADKNKSIREGALVITTPTGYLVYSQVTMEVLNQVCEAHGFHVDIPWKDLTAEQKDIVLNGSDIITIPYGKHSLESRMKWSGITAKPREEGHYKGILPVIENILKRDRNPNILRFVRTATCSKCKGTRFNEEALSVQFLGKNIAELLYLSIEELDAFFRENEDKLNKAQKELISAIQKRTQLMIRLGLGYLQSDRESTSLSGGESQRIRLAVQAGSEMSGMLYILDEPSIGLHASDNRKMISLLKEIRDLGNTIIVVEHEEDFMYAADYIIDIGPEAGVNGGELLFAGWASEFFSQKEGKPESLKALSQKNYIPLHEHRLDATDEISLQNADLHNLSIKEVRFLKAALNVIVGVSGAGKSSLIEFLLAEHKKKSAETGLPARIIHIDQSPIGRTPRSNPATYTKLSDLIRDCYAKQELALQRKWKKGRFSFNVKGGRCEACQGAGYQQEGMHFLGSVELLCEDCSGKRFNTETLEVLYKGKDISEVYDLSIEEALDFFRDEEKIVHYLQTLHQLGLGYMKLGQSSTTLSGGEAQRIKLASELVRSNKQKSLYIFDEPTTGLHAADIRLLMESFMNLLQKGNTVLVIEHHLDIIKNAQRIIDLGPESGKNGGLLMYQGGMDANYLKTDTQTAKAFIKRDNSVLVKKKSSIEEKDIVLKGINTHNIKKQDLRIPLGKLSVITGPSGSGKSSLAFDTLYTEARNRYAESFSTYVRTLLGNKDKGDIERVESICPALAIHQNELLINKRSGVSSISGMSAYLRLLFSRAGKPFCPNCDEALEQGNCTACGFKGHYPLESHLFSPNHKLGACPVCNGLKQIKKPDPNLLITHPELSILSGAMQGTKTGKFYGDEYGQYVASIKAVGAAYGIDYSASWCELSEEAKSYVMMGTGDREYEVSWKYKRGKREGEHQFKGAWLGLLHHVNEEYLRKDLNGKGASMKDVLCEEDCQDCGGAGLRPEALAVRFAGYTIQELQNKAVSELKAFFTAIYENPTGYKLSESQFALAKESLEQMLVICRYFEDLGIAYLSLSRKAESLSGGELQRLRLVSFLSSGLTGVVYILDEPSAGLHPKDLDKLMRLLGELQSRNNTLVIVEHDLQIISQAEHIIELGPEAGDRGGEIVFQGSLDALKNSNTKTAQALKQVNKIQNTEEAFSGFIQIRGAKANNLKHIDVQFPIGGISAISGVSGSGKSSLLRDVLYASMESKRAILCEEIQTTEEMEVLLVEQKQLKASAQSNLLTYLGLFDTIRNLLAKTDKAKALKLKTSSFSMNSKGGRCETCKGKGYISIHMDFLPDFEESCEDCGGTGFTQPVLECTWKEKNIAEILQMKIEEACGFFSDQPKLKNCFDLLSEAGLSYLNLGQSLKTCSGGELQRLKLVLVLLQAKSKAQLILMDEPANGLHCSDIEKLKSILKRLSKEGHSIVFTEHHTGLLSFADYLVELGPEAGDKGGDLLYQGSLNRLKNIKKSQIAAYLSVN